MVSDSQVPQVAWRADPARTHVLCVGISQYEIGPNFELPKAAEHAAQFAEWAHFEGKVPAENIHLFLSEGAPAELLSRLNISKIKPYEATSWELNRFIEGKLKAESGDLLYIFWSGHGSISENKNRILYYQDMKADTPRSLDLTNLLHRLRSEPHRRFLLQSAYVDACANRFEDMRLKVSAEPYKSGYGIPLSGIRQLFFLAADSGQQATAGMFSRLVLQELKGEFQRRSVWPPDPDVVRTAVQVHFEDTGQRPVQTAWRTISGDEDGVEMVKGDLPASDYVNNLAKGAKYPVRFLRRLASLAPGLTGEGSQSTRDSLYHDLYGTPIPANRTLNRSAESDLQGLIAEALRLDKSEALKRTVNDTAFSEELDRMQLLREVRLKIIALPDTTEQDLLNDYLATVTSLASSQERDGALTLDAMLDELTQIQSDDPYRFLWQFLLRVAQRKLTAKHLIETFVRSKAGDFLTNSIRQEIVKKQRFLLSISIEPRLAGTEPLPTGVDAKLLIAGTNTTIRPFPREEAGSWEAAGAAVNKFVLKAREDLRRHRKNDDELDVEVLLEEGCFLKAPDWISVTLTPPRDLGRLHSVVVRWRTRLVDNQSVDQGPWRAAGERVNRRESTGLRWLDEFNPPEADAICQSSDGLLALGFVPSHEIDDLIVAGYPFIAWLRGQPDNGWTKFKEKFGAWAGAAVFEELPRKLISIRSHRNDLGGCLTMFWDDPNYAGHWMTFEEPTYD